MDITLTIDIPNLPLFAPPLARRVLQEEVGRGIHQIEERIANAARLRAPVDRGILRGSIAVRHALPAVGPVLVRGSVGPGPQAPHAGDVERGTAPHWIAGDDFEQLKGWARRKLGDENRAYPVRAAIAKRGQQAQPYMGPAVADVRHPVPIILQGAVALAVRRLSQP